MAATLTDSGELTYASFGIEKVETDPDGDIIVFGKCSDGGLDSDNQVVDPAWMASASKSWLSTGGNLRVQHNAQRDPAGIGLEVNTDNDGTTWLKGLVVEPVAKTLVSKGALRAFSVGIARPTIERDVTGKARGGVITSGDLVEVSLVDRPANARCRFQLVKSAGGAPEYVGKMFGADDVIQKMLKMDIPEELPAPKAEDILVTFTPNDLAKILKSKIIDEHYSELAASAAYDPYRYAEKRDFDRGVGGGVDRDKLPDSDFAGPHRSFPIVTQSDVSDALHLVGHADNPDAVRARIHEIARRKGFSVPDGSDSTSKGESVTDASVTEIAAGDAIKEAEPEVTKDPADGAGQVKDTQDLDSDGDYDDAPGKAAKPKKKGKKLPPWLAQDGKGDGDADDAPAEKCDTTPQAASGATDAAPMSPIPNPNALVESPMPAGRADPDISPHAKQLHSSPEASAMLRFKTIGVDPDLGRLHDLTCAAFDPEDVAKYHPFASFTSVIDEGVWQRKALDAACGPLDKALAMTQVWQAAQLLKAADPADLNDFRAELHKAFRDANPGPTSYPSPGSMSPQRFKRPVITEGHAANSPAYGGPNTSAMIPDTAPNATSFGRPPLSAGHQSPSPSFMKASWEYPSEQGAPTRLDYARLEKEKARQALSSMHDHLAHMFPTMCPLLDQDPYRVEQPAPQVPPTAGIGKSEGGIIPPLPADYAPPVITPADSVAKADVLGEMSDEDWAAFKGMRRKLGKKVLSGKMTVDEARAKMGRRFAQKQDAMEAPEIAKSAVPGATASLEVTPQVIVKGAEPEVIKTMMSEILQPFLDRITEQEQRISAQQQTIDAHNARWEAVANSADPSTKGFTGLAMNPVIKTQPAAVVKTAEIAERTQHMIRDNLVRTYRTSSNPAEREAAYAALEKYGIPTE